MSIPMVSPTPEIGALVVFVFGYIGLSIVSNHYRSTNKYDLPAALLAAITFYFVVKGAG